MGGDSRKWIPIARVGRPHGVRGEMRVFPFDADSQTLFEVDQVRVTGGPGQAGRLFVLRGLRRAHKYIILAFEGVDDRDVAQSFTGAEIEVDPSVLPALPDDEYYHCDLVGLSVEDDKGDKLGVLEEILDTGGHDTLVVRDRDAGLEVMIPFIEGMVEVDEEKGVLVVTPPPGLLEATREPIGRHS